MTTITIDANGLILGRLASMVATRLLNGETIAIINAERTVVSGSKVTTIREYKEMVNKGSTESGPYFPRRADHIVKRTIRGMLPHKRMRGRDALSRLRVYMGTPAELSGSDAETIPEASITRLGTSRYIELGEIGKKLGS
ncbi:MAG: 50S ribosomal protein L13 [Candidatus Methanogasteraceae archaeon]|uniref:Large ribosomal subunit protein uL13 n=1 Tax=Candidatus Methanogaster sp. ANME-2c ERB4 TaxID=2759911 RepID=A0A7G9YBH4_9EURY|nr:MAG: 50S ribosomal protein L13 [ANME-2 cluster archaeon]MEA1866157.1 50S ribosomal protein L13 [Euryarchaeota archaeon]QNO42224.1 50S ribosomal protein L13 [Methanosarcinales archaeon ANME-2c ERB4]QNO43228.1 50S ribosomal protein L13 [Methanosarcinales archaeon ANME-2c ERB4]QNO45358.1 50S ribosomal protein L13 [Methanosarcinales archaeon ANME-2c ERB4]